MLTRSRFLSDRRGSALAVTAVTVGAVMCTLSLAIDLGMLYTARAEAQRAADAAALAGASAFMVFVPASTGVAAAEERARAYATANTVRNQPIQEEEVTVVVRPSEAEVYVRIERQAITLWFARLLGIPQAGVAAAATAAASPAGSARCVAPLALPDMWYNAADDNQIWEPGENWTFDPSRGDYYRRFGDETSGETRAETGYGSDLRNPYDGRQNDYGRQIAIKPQRPGSAPTSGFFHPIRIGDNTGANDYRNSWTNCADDVVTLGQPVDLEMGNMVGPTRQAVNDVVGLDPGAYWDDSAGIVRGSSFGDAWLSSPRILLISMFSPAEIALITGGNHTVTPSDFGLFFVEEMPAGNDAPVYGRFLYYASGAGLPVGDVVGSLTRVLQLVK